jgi:hypothetical protein
LYQQLNNVQHRWIKIHEILRFISLKEQGLAQQVVDTRLKMTQ